MPEASFFTSAWYSSAARCCACDTAASTRSSSISTSPWAIAWGSILIARICPRPSAVAATMPAPAVQVTVCWASWDWISDSRYCICCPSCSRLDKSAIRRKLPLAQTGGKLLEQLQVQRVHGRIETGVTRTQRLQPLRPRPLLRETAGPRSGPLPPLPALPPLPLPAPRALEPDTHRLGDVATDQLGQRLALPRQSLGVDRVGRPRHDGRAVDRDGLDGREQRSEHRLLAPRVFHDPRPETLQALDGQWTLFRDGGRGTRDGCGIAQHRRWCTRRITRPPSHVPRPLAQSPQHLPELDRPCHHRPAQQQQLYREPGVATGAQLRLELGEDGEQTDDVGSGERGAVLLDQGLHRLRESLRLPPEIRQQDRPQHLPPPAHDLAQIRAPTHEPLDQGKHTRRIALGDHAQQLAIHVVRDQTEHLAYAVGGHRPGAERYDLIENRQPVAHPAVRALGDQVEGLVGGLESFRRHDLAQALDDGSRADAPEVEALQPGQDRRRALRDLLRLGGGEDEYDRRRRLFENLEQRVPRFARQHVGLVHDIDLVATLR